MRLFWLIIISFCVCSSTPTGDLQLSDEGDNVLETRIASVENKITWMETNFNNINRRIGELEGELNDKTDKLAKAQKYIARLQNRYISAQKATRHMINRHDEAVQRLAKLEQDTQNLITNYDETNQHVLQNLTKLEQQSENLATEQDEIKQRVTKLDQDTKTLATKQDEIDQRVLQNLTKLDEESENLKNVVSNLQSVQRNENLAALENITPEVTTSAIHQLLKLLVPTTCYHWKQRGFTTSGYYTIDPDGEATGIEPFVVLCDMEKGETLVNHDSETKEQSHACSGPGCFKRSITYNASLKQITALMKKSLSCKQHIELNCQQTSLQHDNESVSWWVDRYGNKHDYWAGNGDNGHTCQCGLTENCDDPGNVCNCNIDTVDSRFTDEGYLSNMSMLPVTELKFGHTSGNNKELNFTLGPLKCFGEKNIKSPESCDEAWMTGSHDNGYYILGTKNSVDVQYCDMNSFTESFNSQSYKQSSTILQLSSVDNRFDQLAAQISSNTNDWKRELENLSQQVTSKQNLLLSSVDNRFDQLSAQISSNRNDWRRELQDLRRVTSDNYEILSRKVVFSAHLGSGYDNTRTYIPFNLVTVNVGNGYDPSTGLFTAQVNGLYVFYTQSDKKNNTKVFMLIKKNGSTLTYCTSNKDVTWATVVCSAVTQLKEGDQVGIFLVGDLVGGYSDGKTLFYGFLLQTV